MLTQFYKPGRASYFVHIVIVLGPRALATVHTSICIYLWAHYSKVASSSVYVCVCVCVCVCVLYIVSCHTYMYYVRET